MNYKISVIIPCYNAEDTIQRAVDSIINQSMSFNNIELLLYDDASSDNTKELIKNYSKNYENIIPIFGTENRGPGVGKNKCLENATGEYVLFLDADDEYDKEMCAKLYSTAKLENADIVSSGVLRNDGHNVSEVILNYDESKALENTDDKIVFIDKNVFYLNDHLATHCLFKLENINKYDIYFLETYYAEDIYFKAIYRIHSKKVVYLKNYFGYIHHTYTDSITSNIDLTHLNEIHDVYLKIFEEIKGFDLDFAYIFEGHIACSLIRVYILNLLNSKEEIKNFLMRINKFEIRINFKHMDNPLLNFLNILILKEKYDLAYIYLHLLKFFYHSKISQKVYHGILEKIL